MLKEQGYDVVGITMQVWDYTECAVDEGAGTCCSSVDVDDARSVADRYDFPFYVMNCEAKFKAYVIDDFVHQYLEGRTPSPCVNCNTFLKFDHLITKMKELNCDYLATGHYADMEIDKKGRPQIRVAFDQWKDQTYFLFTMRKEVLPYLIFPLGGMTKDQVRKYAEDKGLINARKKDSVGICFVGKMGYSAFIESQVAPDLLVKGQIRRHPDGEVVGEHQGIHNFTYGQRRGLGLDHHEPLFVLKIDPKTSTVWVGEEKHLFTESMDLIKTSWLSDVEPGEKLRFKIRAHHEGAWGKVEIQEDKVKIHFEQPQRAITPGQAAVAYRDNQLVGGGWIV
jgi:tRNA-specific 2-thiouridylase